ncbi:MAG: septum formation initiator family protein [Jatrophihabitantaceae bacterium]
MPGTRPERPPRRAITGRALVLGTLVILLVVLLASPLHRYFASRGDVEHASQQLHSDQARLAELIKARERWSDPGYIERQARRRLQYAMPGDTVYIVIGANQQSDIAKSRAGTDAKSASGTWNQRLWETVQKAGS